MIIGWPGVPTTLRNTWHLPERRPNPFGCRTPLSVMKGTLFSTTPWFPINTLGFSLMELSFPAKKSLWIFLVPASKPWNEAMGQFSVTWRSQAVSTKFTQPFKNRLHLYLLHSDGWKAEELNYRWKSSNPVQRSSDTTAFLNDGIKLDSVREERCDVETSTGKYSCIRLVFTFSK